MNRIEQARRHLDKRLLEYGKITIEYHRGNTVSTINCWSGMTVFKVMDQKETHLQWSDRDYLIPVSEFKLTGISGIAAPELNDWIEETFNEPDQLPVKRRFRIAAPEGEQPWRYSGQQKTCYRIHTKEETIT